MHRRKSSPPAPKSKRLPIVHCAFTRLVAIEDLEQHPKNPNTHPKKQLTLYAKVIQENGWRRPITVSKRSHYIVKGHGAYLAARSLGLRMVPVDFQRYTSEADELADMIADNKLAEQAQMNAEKLDELLQQLEEADFDLERAGVLAESEKLIDQAQQLTEAFQILIECKNEGDQVKLLKRFEKEGIECRALTS
jgi:ParB-like chromosome segregation protein Spo0J